MIPAILSTLEIVTALLGGYAFFRRQGSPPLHALPYALLTVPALFSASIHLFFLIRAPRWFFLADAVIVAISLHFILRDVQRLKTDWRFFRGILFQQRLLAWFFFPLLGYIFVQAWFAPPDNNDSMVYNLARVMLFQQEGGLFPANYSTFHQVAFPMGYDLLSFLFLRFPSDYGLGTFSFLSYLTILSATFGLAEEHFGKRIAAITAITTSSLNELVLQASSVKNDIPCAAAAIVIFLAGSRFLKKRRAPDLFILLLALAWGLTIKGYFAGFAAPFVLFYSLLLMKRRILNPGKIVRGVRALFSRRPRLPIAAGAALIALLIMNVAILSLQNWKRFGDPWGDPVLVRAHRNSDGLSGAMMNSARYLIQTASIPIGYGYRINQAYDRLPASLRNAGTRRGFPSTDLAAKNFISEDYEWFGPFGFLLVLPAVIFSLFHGSPYIRICALTLTAFFGSVAWQIAWMPWNNRFFVTFFATSGLCVAFFIHRAVPPGKTGNIAAAFILILAAYNLAATVLQNDQKQTIPVHNSRFLTMNLYQSLKHAPAIKTGAETSGFTWTGARTDRLNPYTRFIPRAVLESFVYKIPPRRRVLFIGTFSPSFPLLMLRPDLHTEAARIHSVQYGGRPWNLNIETDYNVIRRHYDYFIHVSQSPGAAKAQQLMSREELLIRKGSWAVFRIRK